MGTSKCATCGGGLKKNGTTSAGRTRWRCKDCGASQVGRIDNTAKRLEMFLDWLLSRKRQADMPGAGRTFRRKCSVFWQIWPMPPKIEEARQVVFVDGIHLGRRAVVLIASDEKHALGWYVCRQENSRAWAALLARIAAPQVVVSDGGPGFAKVLRQAWPTTRHQRCVFHAFSQVRKYTTSRPRTQAGVELYGLAKALLAVRSLEQASSWVENLFAWSLKWETFLAQTTIRADGTRALTHERLVKAQKSLERLIKTNTLFTYLDPQLCAQKPLPATNNQIEGSANARLRQMLRDHRGLSTKRRLKAIFLWCYQHSPNPLPAAQILRVMPTDQSITNIYQQLNTRQQLQNSIPTWGDAIAWAELHHNTPYTQIWD